MPFRVNHESGLYEMSYTVGRTLEDARQIASSFRLVEGVGQRTPEDLDPHVRQVLMGQLMVIDDPVPEDDGSDEDDDDQLAEADDVVTGEEQAQIEAVFDEYQPGVAKPKRAGLRKMKSLDRHKRLGHIGHHPKCEICMRLRSKRRLKAKGAPNVDTVPGRTVNADSIYLSNRMKNGDKYVIAGRDQKTGFVFHFCAESREQAGIKLLKRIEEVRRDPEVNCPGFCTVLILDPAGEWHTHNAEFMDYATKMVPPVEIDLRQTQLDKRYNASGEVLMRILEEIAKAIVLDTRLEIESFTLAVDHAVFLMNRTPMAKNMSRDGNGPRPLTEISQWRFSIEECDRQLEASVPPGTLCLCRMAKPPLGSNIAEITKYRYGRAVRMEGSGGKGSPRDGLQEPGWRTSLAITEHCSRHRCWHWAT